MTTKKLTKLLALYLPYITASDISDQLLKDFLDMDSSQIVTMPDE